MTNATAATPRDSPYQGLTPFDEHDADYFFGREKEARLISADLFAAPVSLLYGASGVGKSSVLQAGLLPLLRPRSDLLALVFNQWQSSPLGGLKQAVLLAAGVPAVSVDLPLAAFLRKCAKASKRHLMIVLDQFEEYSLYHPSNDDPFAQQLPEATTLGDLSVSFLISLREEAVARLDRFEGRIPALFHNLRRIDHLTEAAARDAIELPLKKYAGGTVSAEPALVTAVVDQVRTGRVQVGDSGRGTTGADGGRIEAPYLQLVMTRIWNEERADNSPRLRLITFNRLGGAEKIVQTHLNAVMQKFTDEERDIAARVFQQLVTPSGTKIAHSVPDLALYAAVDAAKLGRILESLSRGTDRVLRPVAALPERPGDPRYEIFHDRLAPAILGWRSGQVKGQEANEAKAREQEAWTAQAQLMESYLHLVLEHMDATGLRPIAERVLDLFVIPSGTRRIVSSEDVNERAGADSGAAVIDLLRRGGIVREMKRDGKMYFELSHDALIEPILKWRRAEQAAKAPPVASVLGAKTTTTERGLVEVESELLTEGPLTGARIINDDLGPGLAMPELASGSLPRQADSQVIADVLKSGKMVVVLGSGASASDRPPDEVWTTDSSFLPTSDELVRLMAKKGRLPAEELEGASFSGVASQFVFARGRKDLDRLLDSIFSHPYTPTPLHRLLAELAKAVPLLIITTTFDLFMENALRRVKASFEVAYNTLDRKRPLVWRGEQITVNDFKPENDKTIVYKMFGSHSATELYTPRSYKGSPFSFTTDSPAHSPSSYIITEEDDMELFSHLAEGRLPPPQVKEALQTRHVLFIGMGLGAWPQRLMLRQLRSDSESSRGWAIARGLSGPDRACWRAARVETFDEDIAGFTQRLADALGITL